MNNLPYYNSSDKPFGLSYDAWMVKWWQWIWSITDVTNPLNDQTGKNAFINQLEKDVRFLTETLATEKLLNVSKREVTIPSDRAILLSVINCEAKDTQAFADGYCVFSY